MVWLKRRHDSEIIVDASELLWRLFGTMIHKVMELYDNPNALKEEKLVEKINGCQIVGKLDLLVYKKITDYKITSVWTHIYGSRVAEWTTAQNMYAWLFRKATFEVEELEIVELFRDWSKGRWELEKGGGYPWRVETVKLDLWDTDKTEEVIRAHLYNITQYENTSDDGIPECSATERWEDPKKWAVMKGKNKRAIKLYDNQDDAEKHAESNDDLWVQERVGTPKRCLDYCDVAPFCHFYKQLVKEEK